MKLRNLALAVLLGVFCVGASAPHLSAPGSGSGGGPFTITANPGDTLQTRFNALKPSIAVARDVGADEAWVELTAGELGQRFRSPDTSMTFTLGMLPIKRTGDVEGKVFLEIEASSGTTNASGPVATGCTSTAINAENIIPDKTTHVAFPFPSGCTLAADTLYWVVLSGDAAYQADFTTGAAGKNVSWWLNGDNYTPCQSSWNNFGASPADKTGGCDGGIAGSGTGSWTVDTDDDFSFALGTPQVIKLNPGSYPSQFVQVSHVAFLTITGDGQNTTFWGGALDSGGTAAGAINAQFSYGWEIANIHFYLDVDEGADTPDLALQPVMLSFDANSLGRFHDLKIDGTVTGLRIGNSSDTFVYDLDVDALCDGVILDVSKEGSASFRNTRVRTGSLSDSGTGTAATCSDANLSGITLTGVAADATGIVEMNGVTVEVNNYQTEACVIGIGSACAGASFGTYKGTVDIRNTRVEVNQKVANDVGGGAYGIELGAGAFGGIYDSTVKVVASASDANTTVTGIRTGTEDFRIERTSVTTSAGAGTVLDIQGGGDAAADDLVLRNVVFDPAKYSDGGTTTEDFSPSFGSGLADVATPTTITVNGATTGHTCNCSSTTATCLVTNARQVANGCDATWAACTDGVDTITCTATKLP